MMIAFKAGQIVHCEAKIALPLPITTAWGQLRDFHRFAAQDHFHARIQVEGNIPRAGAKLLLFHWFLGFKTVRRGKILRWRENEGYAFSDLSLNGHQRGFPHVIGLRLESISAKSCVLHLRVSGRWTAPVPRWMAWLWLWWVFSHLNRSIENQLLGFAVVWRRLVAPSASTLNRTGSDLAGL